MNNKLLYLFILSLFCIVSCDQQVVDEANKENPIEGEWCVFNPDGSILHQRVYTTDFYAYFSVIDGVLIPNPEMQSYTIRGNDKLLFDRYIQTFVIKEDSLWITNSGGDKQTKYIRNKNSSLD